MKKRMRLFAGALAVVMSFRYSEVGFLVSHAENYGNYTYQDANLEWHSMIAKDIDLYYQNLYQYGIHDTETEVSYEDGIKGMLYDRAETALHYSSALPTTSFETDFFSRSKLFIHSETTTISNIVAANLEQQINGTSFLLENTGILYSLEKDITINVSQAEIKGLIYAPNGTVTINADAVKLSGLKATVQPHSFPIRKTGPMVLTAATQLFYSFRGAQSITGTTQEFMQA